RRFQLRGSDGRAGERTGRAVDLRQGGVVVKGGDAQHVARDLRQCSEAVGEGPFQALGQWELDGVRIGGGAERARQLGQRQRVAGRGGQHPPVGRGAQVRGLPRQQD